jgi:opacity protein-like surface antigen
MSEYEEGTAGLLGGDWNSYSVYAGVSYSIRPALSMNARINHTTSNASSNIPNRDFSRNNYQVGLNYSF